jgi:hypothetical protein
VDTKELNVFVTFYLYKCVMYYTLHDVVFQNDVVVPYPFDKVVTFTSNIKIYPIVTFLLQFV